MKKVFKWALIAFAGFIVIGIIANAGAKDTTTDKPSPQTENAVETQAEEKEDIEIIKHSSTNTGEMNMVHVQIKNNTDKLLTSGLIKTIYTDKDGNIVGTGNGSILNLASGATKTIDCLAMGVEGAENYSIEVEPLLYE